MYDSDDEVRDRAAFYISLLSGSADAAVKYTGTCCVPLTHSSSLLTSMSNTDIHLVALCHRSRSSHTCTHTVASNVSIVGLEKALVEHIAHHPTTPFNIKTVPVEAAVQTRASVDGMSYMML